MLKQLLLGVLLACWASFAGAQVCSGNDRLLFKQPSLAESDFEQVVVSPHGGARSTPPPTDRFTLVLWQRNPYSADGNLTSSKWTLDGFLGERIASRTVTRAVTDKPYVTSVQLGGDTVGAYLDSQNFAAGGDQLKKLMITPQYKWSDGKAPRPFSNQADKLKVGLLMQIPNAADMHRPGSAAYANLDLLFVDSKSGTRISVGAGIFSNGRPDWRGGVGFDAPSRAVMVNQPLNAGAGIFSLLPSSSQFTAVPWRNWRPFYFSMDREQFAEVLKRASAKAEGAAMSLDPSAYALGSFHLNAELRFDGGDAKLTWFMKGAEICLGE